MPEIFRIRSRPYSAKKLSFGRRIGRADVAALTWKLVRRHVPDEAIRLERIRSQWHEIATARLSARTWPALVAGRTLHIDVQDAQWVHELHYAKSALLERLQAICAQGQVHELRFRLGAVPPLASRPGIPAADTADLELEPGPLSATIPPETEAVLYEIQDPELRSWAAAARLAFGKPRMAP